MRDFSSSGQLLLLNSVQSDRASILAEFPPVLSVEHKNLFGKFAWQIMDCSLQELVKQILL